jgi:hypothetical protein
MREEHVPIDLVSYSLRHTVNRIDRMCRQLLPQTTLTVHDKVADFYPKRNRACSPVGFAYQRAGGPERTSPSLPPGDDKLNKRPAHQKRGGEGGTFAEIRFFNHPAESLRSDST